MKVAIGGQDCIIKTKRKYTIQELFEILRKANLEEKFGPFELKKGLFIKSILFQGLKGFTNTVTAGKKAILVSQAKKRLGLGKATLLNVATAGIYSKVTDISNASHLFGLGGAKDNKEVMKALAEEIEKLVEVK